MHTNQTTFGIPLVIPTDTFIYYEIELLLDSIMLLTYTVSPASFPPLILLIRLFWTLVLKPPFTGVSRERESVQPLSTKEGQRSVTTRYQTCRVLLLRPKQSSLIIVTRLRAMASHHRLSSWCWYRRAITRCWLPSHLSSLPRAVPRVGIRTIVPDQLNRHFPR